MSPHGRAHPSSTRDSWLDDLAGSLPRSQLDSPTKLGFLGFPVSVKQLIRSAIMAYTEYEVAFENLYLQSGSTEDMVFYVRPGHGLDLVKDAWPIYDLSV